MKNEDRQPENRILFISSLEPMNNVERKTLQITSSTCATNVCISAQVFDGSIMGLPWISFVLFVTSTLDIFYNKTKVNKINITGICLRSKEEVGSFDIIVSETSGMNVFQCCQNLRWYTTNLGTEMETGFSGFLCYQLINKNLNFQLTTKLRFRSIIIYTNLSIHSISIFN